MYREPPQMPSLNSQQQPGPQPLGNVGMGQQLCNMGSATREPEVAAAFERLEAEVNLLSGVAEMLCERLSPVMRQDPEKSPPVAQLQTGSTVPVVCALDDLLRRICGSRSRLESTLQRLEV